MPIPLDVRPTDRPRLPPGQIETRKWPVLHYGQVPSFDPETWSLTISGTVERPLTLSWEEVLALPRTEVRCDIHCVTRWSRFDNLFSGIATTMLAEQAGLRAEARFALVHGEQGYTTNLPVADLLAPGCLIALRHNGEDLTPEHGGPARLVVPHLYFWKSAKWIRGIEFLPEDYPGFWEQNGYHKRGDPWKEERYGRPDPVRMRRGDRMG